MNAEDWNRAKDNAESMSEMMLLEVVGLPKPWTAIVTISVLILAGIGSVTVWNAF